MLKCTSFSQESAWPSEAELICKGHMLLRYMNYVAKQQGDIKGVEEKTYTVQRYQEAILNINRRQEQMLIWKPLTGIDLRQIPLLLLL